MQKTYLFYDIETSGLNKCFDQVLQFAAIRTTLSLKEIERYQFSIKLNKDVIPSPSALITHRIPIQDLLKGQSEFEVMTQIHALMNSPGTISLGYNTLNFDDEFLRFSFYRNLLPPYTHQYANQCGRLDIFPITLFYFLYQKNALHWPVLNGKPSLRLEYLNAENGFYQGRAHDAMVDVEVTLRLAQRLFEYSDMWNYVIGYFDKKEDQSRTSKLSNHLFHYPQGLAISPDLGSQNHFQSIVLNLGSHHSYKNQTLWLRLDRPDLSNVNPENIPQNTWVLRKRWGEPCFLLPMKERFMQLLDPRMVETVESNGECLSKQPELLRLIEDYHRYYQYPPIEQVDIDALLYQSGFLEPYEQAWCYQFHLVSTEEKVALVDSAPSALLKEQSIRLLGRNFFESLTSHYKEMFTFYLNERMRNHQAIDYRGELRKTPQSIKDEINQLKTSNQLDSEQFELLEQLERYIASII